VRRVARPVTACGDNGASTRAAKVAAGSMAAIVVHRRFALRPVRTDCLNMVASVVT